MPVAPVKRPRVTSLLAFVFFCSGFASLLYQVVWQRLLTVHFGVGAVSITLIVSVYMFGLGLGSLLGGWLAERVRQKILWYFVVEFLLGVFGLSSLPFLDLIGRATAGSGYLTSFFSMFLFLSLPTFLMGVTLPLLTKIFNAFIQDFLDSVSFLYFVNTLGAATGALVASYVVISFFGLDSAVYVAACLNFILAGLIFYARMVPDTPRAAPAASSGPAGAGDSLGRVAYLLVLVTGFLAIGYEIVWFRVIGILVKNSPYAFSTVLAVYLLGIALGSQWMRRSLARGRTFDRRDMFFLIQFCVGVSVAVLVLAYYHATVHTILAKVTLTSFRIDLHPPSRWIPGMTWKGMLGWIFSVVDIFLWPLFFVFIPTLLMGASFPLISSLALTRPDREGATVGVVYFWNILGNVLGGIVTGFVLLPILGSETTLLLFTLVGVSMLLFVRGGAGARFRPGLRIASVAAVGGVTALLFPGHGRLYEALHVPPGPGYAMHQEEGVDGIIVTYEKGESVDNYISGLSHGGRPIPLFYYEALEAMAYAPRLGNVLVIGYGTGSTVEALLASEEVRRITLVELSDTLLRNLRKMDLFERMLDDPRVEIVIDDGRRYLLGTRDRYDVIFIDSQRPTTAYSNNLYSREFFELLRDHMTPDGVLMLWTNEHPVMSKTVASVFDHMRKYRFFALASPGPLQAQEARRRRLLSRFPASWTGTFPEIARGVFIGDRSYVIEATRPFPINTDWRPVNEYYLGLRTLEALGALPRRSGAGASYRLD